MTKSLLTMNDLTTLEIFDILKDAKSFSYSYKDWQFSKPRMIANLFFEPSTRTHYSFLSAEQQLGMKVANFNPSTSSQAKGESLSDTCRTFEALGYEALVIRHGEAEYFKDLKQYLTIPIINGGDGSANHPSQCLLDLYTIYDEFGKFDDLNVLIVGDIKHSHVAGSNVNTLERLGANVKVSGPEDLQHPNDPHFVDLDEGIEWADVVMMLRIQHERHQDTLQITKEEYLTQYGLNQARANRMKKHTIIMHPAPVNRGVEIESHLVESDQSRIFDQMRNGVYVRKAILKSAFEGPTFETLSEGEMLAYAN